MAVLIIVRIMIVRRILAFYIDLVVVLFVFFLVIMLLVRSGMSMDENFMNLLFSIISFILLSCKDCVLGISPGKWVLGLKVVDAATLKTATIIQCITRNYFCVIWPIEFLFILWGSPKLRLGDRVAHTKMIKTRW